MIVCTFAFRYEPDWMIDQLYENVGWVDGFATWDTRGHPNPWIPRKERARVLEEKARRMGADWLLVVSPDERLEPAAEGKLRRLAQKPHDRYRFRVRELWTPTAYRVDGRWGNKTGEARFYRLGARRPVKTLDLNVYHLKMIDPANRAERVRVHKQWNDYDNRRVGFDYLADETGLALEEIPEGRMYQPPYRPYRFEVEA